MNIEIRLSDSHLDHYGLRPDNDAIDGIPSHTTDRHDRDAAGSEAIIHELGETFKASGGRADYKVNRIRREGLHFDGGATFHTYEAWDYVTAAAAFTATMYGAIRPLIKQWLQNRAKREVEVRVGTAVIRMKGDMDLKQIKRALDAMKELQATATLPKPRAARAAKEKKGKKKQAAE